MRMLKTCAWVSIALGVMAAPVLAQAPFEVRWENERLTVRSSNALLIDVVREVSRQTHIDVIGGDKLAGLTSVEFSDLTLERGVAALLSGANYVLQEQPGADGASPNLVLRVLSMAGGALPDATFTGPVSVGALDSLVAEEESDARDAQEVDLEDLIDDADSIDDLHKEKLDASNLASKGTFGPQADLESLLQHLRNPNEWIRIEAINALAKRPVAPALPALIKVLNDESWAVRNVAVTILGGATDATSLRAVGQWLESDSDRDLRISALRVVAMRGEPASIPNLRAVLADEDERLRDIAAQLIKQLEARQELRRANAAKK